MGVTGGNIRAREINPDQEKSDVSLDLSLSLDNKSNNGVFLLEWSDADTDDGISLQLSLSSNNMSTGMSKIDKGKLEEIHCKKSEGTTMSCMEMSRGAFPSEWSDSGTDGGISLQLFLSGDNMFTATFKIDKEKQVIVYKESVPNMMCMGKNSRALSQEPTDKWVADQLRNGPSHDTWCIRKRLTVSDLSDMSRLLLASESVESHILSYWDEDRKAQNQKGLQVWVHDCDTNSEHAMVFKRWDNGAHVLINKWIPQFVKRGNLKLNDEIGLI
ncbi:hypothetical protein V6N13_026321 [Hibiscus sabdariffa]|uniref:B3 domain-containing protein n=1 Tax=Hibiscus sabdariffa TaxID=183260 RepID=A0ABR2P6R1_9ROSI